MSSINFLSENLVDNADFELITGTENAQFPLTNILNESPSYKFRSLDNSVVIRFDLKQQRTIDSVALHGDTNNQLGVTAASIRTSLTTDFSASDVTSVNLSGEERLGYVFFEPTVCRYVEVTISGTGPYSEVSNIYIGERINLVNQNISIASFSYGFQDRSSVSENQYGQKFVDKRNSTKTLGGSLQHCVISEQEVLDNMFSRHGKSLPLWLIMDADGNSIADGEFKLSIYGYLADRPTWSASGGQTYNADIQVNQAG
jgi:hypothetical protein